MNVETIHTEITRVIWKTVNKFRENPYYFFTESDIHSYFYYCIYSMKLEFIKDNKRIYLVHREYPTNFRYRKKDLLNDNYVPPSLDKKLGTRGHYDLAVLNPSFVEKASSCEDIINKNVSLLEKRIKNINEDELLAAIEFKYVITGNKNFEKEVSNDLKKLEMAKKHGVEEAYCLVFCNIEDCSVVRNIRKIIEHAPREINAVFVQSYYNGDNEKITPKPIINFEIYQDQNNQRFNTPNLKEVIMKMD